MQASLTVRTNEEFDSCRVRKGRDDIVTISDRDRGQQVRLVITLLMKLKLLFVSVETCLAGRGGGSV